MTPGSRSGFGVAILAGALLRVAVLADVLWCLALAPFCYLLFISLGPGADFEKYWDWGMALAALDPRLIQSTTLSPVGFPLSMCGPGAGVFFALPAAVAGVAPHLSFHLMGVLAVLLLLALLAVAGRTFFAAERSLVVLGLGVLLGGTNLGLYTRDLSSDLIATLLVVGPALVLRIGRVTSGPAFALVGAAAGVMLLCRPQALPMLLPAAAIALGRGVEDGTPVRRLALHAALGASLASLALPIVFLVNTWMTGSPLGSPYVFGDETFSSWTPAAPFLRQVLFSDGTGLIRHHLPTLLGVLTAVALVARRWTNRVEVLYHASLLIAFALQVWIIAGWFRPSGSATYGSRFLLPISVLLTFTAVEGLGEEGPRRRGTAYVLLAVVAAGGFWFATAFASLEALAVLGAVALAVQAATSPCRQDQTTRLPRALGECALWVGNTLLLAYLKFLAGGLLLGPRALLFVLAAGLLLLGACTTTRAVPVAVGNAGARRTIAAATILLLAFMGYVWISFIRFTPVATAYQAKQLARPDDRYQFRAPFEVESIIEDVEEAEAASEVSAEEARRQRAFLERAKDRIRIAR